MGRKKKDHRFHVLQGTDSGKGSLKSSPPPVSERPRSPKWLGDFAKEFHLANWYLVDEMGTYTQADKDSWFVGCQRYQRIREAEAEIDKHGLVVKGRGDEIKRNPACAILKAELDLFRRFCETFALDPGARSKLGIRVTPTKKSIMEELID